LATLAAMRREGRGREGENLRHRSAGHEDFAGFAGCYGRSRRSPRIGGAGEPVRFLFPLENFSAQTKSCGAACPNWARRKRRRWPARLRIHIAQREDVAMKHSDFTPSPQPFELDLDDLLHPAQAFAHPRDVVTDGDLTVNEKRAVLASWASDACAVERAPALRRAPGAAGACRLTRSWRPSAHSTSKRTMPPAGPCGLGARRGAGHSRRSGSVVVLPARKAGFRATIPT